MITVTTQEGNFRHMFSRTVGLLLLLLFKEKRLGGINSWKYKTSSWHLNGFPDGNNIGSTV